MKKLAVLSVALLLSACGGSTGSDNPSPNLSGGIDISGNYKFVSTDCVNMDFSDGTLANQNKDFKDEDEIVQTYTAKDDTSSGVAYYGIKTKVLGWCPSEPNVASDKLDKCQVLCLADVVDGTIQAVCDDGLSGNMCNLEMKKN